MAHPGASTSIFRQPSVAVVIVAGVLTVVFLVAIVRELFQGHQVRTQVGRLRQELETEQHRQTDLQDLISYLSSPTFQERQARLELGLKKDGERVVIVPPNQDPQSTSTTDQGPTTATAVGSNPVKWWSYFIHHGK